MIVAYIADPQTTMDWVQLVLTGGVSLAILIYIARLVERRILPSWEKRNEEDREERRQERKEWDEKERQFIATLAQINANLAANTQAVQQLAGAFKDLAADAKRRDRGTRP